MIAGESKSVAEGQSLSLVHNARWLAPTGLVSGVVVVAVVAGLLCGIGFWTNPDINPFVALGWSLVLCSPLAWAMHQGHCGTSEWDYPSISLCVVLLWMLALVPSAVAIGNYSTSTFTLEGEFWGRVVTMVWFGTMVWGLGRAPARYRTRQPPIVDPKDLGISLGLALVALVVVGYSANQIGSLSPWSQGLGGGAREGTLETHLTDIFVTLSVFLMCVGGLLQGQLRRTTRWIGRAAITIGFVALYVSSSRRAIISSAVFCLASMRTGGYRISLAMLGGSFALLAVVLGPLTWVYRTGLEQRSSGDISALSVAAEAVVSVATDADARQLGTESSTSNLSERLSLSPQLFTIVDEVLTRGPKYSPTMMHGLANLIPTPLWAGKNEYAAQYDLEAQMIETGRFPKTDLGPTPLLECVFEIGLVLGPLMGVIYGWLIASLGRLMHSADRALWRWLFCLHILLVIAGTEGTLSALIISSRIAAFMAMVAFLPRVIQRMLTRAAA